ncbi:stimulated by retinoic acid gene 6 protein-like [Clytia hemisphaerica]
MDNLNFAAMNFDVLESVYQTFRTSNSAGDLLTTFLNGEFERQFENSDEVVKNFVNDTLPCMINITRIHINETMRAVTQSLWTNCLESDVKDFYCGVDNLEATMRLILVSLALVLLILLTLGKSRKSFKLGCCFGRPAPVVPLNMLDNYENRYAYMFAFGVTVNSCVDVLFGDYKGIVGESNASELNALPPYFSIIIKVALAAFICIIAYPFFIAHNLRNRLLGSLIGFCYTAFYTAQLMSKHQKLANKCWPIFVRVNQTKRRYIVIFEDIPRFCCLFALLYLFGDTFVRILYKRWKKPRTSGVGLLFNDYRDDWKKGYHYIHVKDVFRKHIVAREKERWENVLSDGPPIQTKILNFIKSKAYEVKPGFQYSTRIMIATFIGILAVYLILVQLVSYGYIIFTKTWNQILDKERIIWLAKNIELPVPLIQKHVDGLQACWWLAMLWATVLQVLTVLNSLVWYRRHVLMLRRGDRSFLPSSIKKGSLNAGDLMTASFKYAGFQVGYSAWGYLIKHAVFWLIFSFLSVFFFVPLFYGGPSFLITLIKGYWPSVIVAIIAVFVQNGLARGCFLLSKENVSVDNRRGFHITSYVLFYFNVFIGIASCLLRLAYGAILGVVMLSRLQKSTLPRSYERRDPGFLAYLGFLMVEHQHSNPVLHCFVRILLGHIDKSLQQDEFTVVRRETKVLLKTYGSADNAEWGANGCPLSINKSRQRTAQDVSRSAQIRWHLAVILIQNPSIRRYRGHYIRRHIPVKHLTRALFMQFNAGKELEGESNVDIDNVRAAAIGYQYRTDLYNSESPELTTSEKFKQWLQFEKFCKHHSNETSDDVEPEESLPDTLKYKANENFKKFLQFMKFRERSTSNVSSNSSTTREQKVESLDVQKMIKSVTEVSIINAESADTPNVVHVSPRREKGEQRNRCELNIEMEEVHINEGVDETDKKTQNKLDALV